MERTDVAIIQLVFAVTIRVVIMSVVKMSVVLQDNIVVHAVVVILDKNVVVQVVVKFVVVMVL